MSRACFDKALAGSVASHLLPLLTWLLAKDCWQNPADRQRQGMVFWLAAPRDLANPELAHPPVGQNNSNRDVENSWRRDYIKKRVKDDFLGDESETRLGMSRACPAVGLSRAKIRAIPITRNIPALVRST